MKSIIFGIVNTSAPRMKKRRKLPSHAVTHNKMWAIQLLTFLIKKMVHTFAYFLLEVVVRTELTVSIIIKYLI